jgi:hypothetical protein
MTSSRNREAVMSENAPPERLTTNEWDALIAASARLKVEWEEDGSPYDRQSYAALERAIRKIGRTIGPSR